MVRILLLLAVAALSIPAVSCSRYYRVDEQYDKGDFLKAYRTLQEIRDQNTVHYQRRYFRIVTRLALEGDRDFIGKLRVLTTQETSPEISNYAQFARSIVRFLDARGPDQYQEVTENLREARTIPGEFQPYAYKIRGIAFYKMGRTADAVSDLNQSFRILPGADSLYFLGLCYLDQDDAKTASGYFQKVISGTQDPFYKSLGYYQLGEIEYYQKRYTQALEKYLSAVNEYSQSADYASRISRCLRKLRYYSASHKFARTALRIRSDYADAWFFLNLN